MKPVFKCDYCSKMGTEKEIREHEPVCVENYDKKNCYTCTHRHFGMKDGQWCYECKVGEEIPMGKIIEFCNSYDRKEKADNPLTDLFGDIFGH